jgi:transcriptional regulator with XRE-family HTH domain
LAAAARLRQPSQNDIININFLSLISDTRLVMITTAQLRAARALIGWTQDELAARSGISKPTIARLELSTGPIGGYAGTREKLVMALEKVGVIFVAENGEGVGVRLKKSAPGLDAQIADAKQRSSANVPAGASPASGMAILRRGHAQNELRTLKEKRRRTKQPE